MITQNKVKIVESSLKNKLSVYLQSKYDWFNPMPQHHAPDNKVILTYKELDNICHQLFMNGFLAAKTYAECFIEKEPTK